MPFSALQARANAAVLDKLSSDATLNGAPVKVIFNEAYQQQQGFVEASNPVARISAADIVNLAHGATLVVDTRTFHVREIQRDGNGMALLQLSSI